jgi:hypothetical protein
MVWDSLNKPGTESIKKSPSIWVSEDLHSYNLPFLTAVCLKGVLCEGEVGRGRFD